MNCSYLDTDDGYLKTLNLRFICLKYKIVMLHFKSPDDVMTMGIANYNQECRQIVMRYSNEWEVSF